MKLTTSAPLDGRSGAESSWHQSTPTRQRSRWDILTPCWDVLGAGHADPRQALEVVCRWYWYPVYGFLRSLGVGADDAHDVTQGFFAGLLERNDLARLDPARGRFRCWLRTAAKHHLYNQLDRDRAKKRGRARTVSIDALSAEERLRIEPKDEHLASDELFDRRWALTVIDRTLTRLRALYASKGKAELFAELEGTLAGADATASDAELGVRLGKSPAAIRQDRHRMRGQYRRLLRQEVRMTVSHPGAIDDEIKRLIAALA